MTRQVRRAGTVVPGAENSGDLITADHKILSEGSESRNNRRYAVVVQNLATQWEQSNSNKTKTSQETQKNLMKFLEPTRKPKVIYTDNSLKFGKLCEELSWNQSTSTPHRSETNGIAERAVRRVKEGTSEQWSNITLFLRKTYRDHINLGLSRSCLATLSLDTFEDVMGVEVDGLEEDVG